MLHPKGPCRIEKSNFGFPPSRLSRNDLLENDRRLWNGLDGGRLRGLGDEILAETQEVPSPQSKIWKNYVSENLRTNGFHSGMDPIEANSEQIGTRPADCGPSIGRTHEYSTYRRRVHSEFA